MTEEYLRLLEDETFKSGAPAGQLRTALTIMTDMLVELNALEIYYEKPVVRSITPPEIGALRRKIEDVKGLLHESITTVTERSTTTQ